MERPTHLAELHCHLDGSLRPETFFELSQDPLVDLHYTSVEEMKGELCFQPGWGLTKCLGSFGPALQVLQTPDNLERAAYELCEDMHKGGVTYLEERYCPTLHMQRGMRREEVMEAVSSGISRGRRDLGIDAHQIITALRNPVNPKEPWEFCGPEEAVRLVKLATEYKTRLGIVGVDLAGDENLYPPHHYIEAFSLAHQKGMHITIHAGEGEDLEQAISNIMLSMNLLYADRIGHGVALGHDYQLMEILAQRCIAVEVCPTSNIHTDMTGKAGYHNHFGVGFFRNHRGMIAPCADNTFMSQTSTWKEYENLARAQNLAQHEVDEIASDAYDARFGY